MQEIRRIKRKDLDVEKYTKALGASLNYRIYAEAWYLDVLTHQKWECWVYGDYEVIMPVPLQLKFGFKFVLQPAFCQQLGVFYKKIISRELFRQFEEKLHRYRVRSYHFNEENTEAFEPKGEKRTNYILDLNRTYEEIQKGYRKDKHKNIKRGLELGLDVETYFDYGFYKNLMDEFYPNVNPFHYELFQTLRDKESLLQLNLKWEDTFNNCRYFILSKNRIIVISSARNKGKKVDFSSFLIDSIIRRFAGQNLLLDFEGSMLKGVADFNAGFGAHPSNYTVYSNNFFKL